MAKSELTAVVEPKCQRLADELGFELVDVALDKEDTGKYLRIYIDKEAGIDLNDCEKFHRPYSPSWRATITTSWRSPAPALTVR